jgi:hypothetical protein
MSELNLNQVNPEEYLARYILQKSQFSAANQRVKYSTFLPAPNGETSVFRISNLSDSEIWKIGNIEVAQKRGLLLLGRADISAFKVLNKNLKIIPDNIPPRHANIIGWPEEKSKQKLIAMELSENAQLRLK